MKQGFSSNNLLFTFDLILHLQNNNLLFTFDQIKDFANINLYVVQIKELARTSFNTYKWMKTFSTFSVTMHLNILDAFSEEEKQHWTKCGLLVVFL